MPFKAMKAAVVSAPRQCRIEEVPLPEPSAGEVRVRLEGCGVCASNLPPWEGRPWFQYPMSPGNLGHEGWGVIDAVGPSGTAGLHEGQRVAMLSEHAYAEYDVAPANRVICLPNEVSGRAFPGEPLGCAVNIWRRSKVQAGQDVAIVGIGFLGAVLTQLCAATGAHVIALSRRQYSLDIARQMGADEVVLMDDHHQAIDHVRQLTGGQYCNVVIEAAGKQWPLDLAGELVKTRGRLVVAGYHQDGPRQVNMQMWNWKGLDVINAHEREPNVYINGMREAAELVRQGRLNLEPLLTHHFELERLGEALEATDKRPSGFVKALVKLGMA